MHRTRFFILILFGVYAAVFGQTNSDSLVTEFQGEHTYSRAIIYQNNETLTKINVNDLTIVDNHLKFSPIIKYNPDEQSPSYPSEMELADVYMLQISKGTKALQYALLGGLSLGAGAALGVLQAEAEAASNPFMETDDDIASGLIIGFTIGGLVIGGIYGSTQHKWQTIYMKESTSYNPGIKWHLGMNYSPRHKAPLLSLQFSH